MALDERLVPETASALVLVLKGALAPRLALTPSLDEADAPREAEAD